MNKEDFYRHLEPLRTERLLLRQMTENDAADVFEYASDPEVVQFLRWGPHPNADKTRQYLHDVLSEYAAGTDGPWAIELRSNSRVIGAIHAMDLDLTGGIVEIGYLMSRQHWNRSVMTEALTAVVGYCFDVVGLNRIQAFCKTENPASARVLDKCGMVLEGTMRDYWYEKGRLWDLWLYAVLRRDYERA